MIIRITVLQPNEDASDAIRFDVQTEHGQRFVKVSKYAASQLVNHLVKELGFEIAEALGAGAAVRGDL